MMAQFLEIKAAHPESLLFYRMGDFYEMFFEDALLAAKALDITLTKRGRHEGQDIPMCGVPVHAADGYLSRLIRHGFKVAICEQMEDPAAARKRGTKSVVKREVIRLVTAGHDHRGRAAGRAAHNYLAALAEAGGALALGLARHVDRRFPDPAAWPEAGAEPGALAAVLARLSPGELVLVPSACCSGPSCSRSWASGRRR